jgi:hypothetical protein
VLIFLCLDVRVLLERFFLKAIREFDLIVVSNDVVVEKKVFEEQQKGIDEDKRKDPSKLYKYPSMTAMSRWFDRHPERTRDLGVNQPYPPVPQDTLYGKLSEEGVHVIDLATAFLSRLQDPGYKEFMKDVALIWNVGFEEFDEGDAALYYSEEEQPEKEELGGVSSSLNE